MTDCIKHSGTRLTRGDCVLCEREVIGDLERKLAEAREVISCVVDGSFNQRDVIRFASQCEWYKDTERGDSDD